MNPAGLEQLMQRARPILARLPAGRPVMVEVGIFKGALGAYLLSHRPDLTWYGVDNWLPAPLQPPAYRATGDMHANAPLGKTRLWKAAAHVAVEQFGRRATIYAMSSLDAARELLEQSVDLVFLDGDHSYPGVRADLNAWWPIVKPGGWLGCHDYAVPEARFRFGVQKAVDEFAAELRLPIDLDEGCCAFIQKPKVVE